MQILNVRFSIVHIYNIIKSVMNVIVHSVPSETTSYFIVHDQTWCQNVSCLFSLQFIKYTSHTEKFQIKVANLRMTYIFSNLPNSSIYRLYEAPGNSSYA
jgi:hypothetical protein